MLLERIEILQNQNAKLMREGETQRKQYEKCLDDVANQVVKALLTQKVSLILQFCTCLLIANMSRKDRI